MVSSFDHLEGQDVPRTFFRLVLRPRCYIAYYRMINHTHESKSMGMLWNKQKQITGRGPKWSIRFLTTLILGHVFSFIIFALFWFWVSFFFFFFLWPCHVAYRTLVPPTMDQTWTLYIGSTVLTTRQPGKPPCILKLCHIIKLMG